MELKPCPFCGSVYYKPFLIDELVYLPCDCLKVPFEDGGYTLKNWNTRPIEDALQAKLNIAVEALIKANFLVQVENEEDAKDYEEIQQALKKLECE